MADGTVMNVSHSLLVFPGYLHGLSLILDVEVAVTGLGSGRGIAQCLSPFAQPKTQEGAQLPPLPGPPVTPGAP